MNTLGARMCNASQLGSAWCPWQTQSTEQPEQAKSLLRHPRFYSTMMTPKRSSFCDIKCGAVKRKQKKIAWSFQELLRQCQRSLPALLIVHLCLWPSCSCCRIYKSWRYSTGRKYSCILAYIYMVLLLHLCLGLQICHHSAERKETMSLCLKVIFLLQKLLTKTKVFSGLSDRTEMLLLKVAAVSCFSCPSSFLPPGYPTRGLLFGCKLFFWCIHGDTVWLQPLALRKVKAQGEKYSSIVRFLVWWCT